MIFPLRHGSLLLVLLVSSIGFSTATRLGSPPQNPAPKMTKARPHNYQYAGGAKHVTKLGSPPENPAPKYVETQDVTQQANTTNSTFLLKLYWQLGYYWQEETLERKWCMECEFGCVDGGNVQIRECDNTVPDQHFEVVVGIGGDQIKVGGQDLCLTHVRSRAIELQVCNLADDHQLWVGFKAGGERFELSPQNSTGCVTNKFHHPKDMELIWVDECENTREDTTNFWNTY